MPRRSRGAFEALHALFQNIEQLESATTAWQVADGCAAAVMKALQARAVVIHQYLPSRREVRVIGAFGPKRDDLLGRTVRVDEDFVAKTVLSNGEALIVHLDNDVTSLAAQRLDIVGAASSLTAVPILGSSGCVAIIEIVDADESRTECTMDVCGVVAEQLVRTLESALG